MAIAPALLAAALLPWPAAAQTPEMRVYPAMLQDGGQYAIIADDQRRITRCRPVAGGPETPEVAAACARLVARGIPASVVPARSLTNPATWISDDDYPTSALRDRKSGAVEILFEVNAQGRVSDCAVYATTGSAAINKAACAAIIARARFSPATYRGTPVPSVTISKVRMWIP